MKETYVGYRMNGHDYKLDTEGSIFRIVRDEEVIHVQLIYVNSHKPCVDIGLKNLNEVVGNLKDYILFCESTKVFDHVSFREDEWARHTKIFAKFAYKTPEGEIMAFEQNIDSVGGEMKSSQADRKINERYITFVKNKTLKELEERHKKPVIPISFEKLEKILNSKYEGFEVYRKMNNQL